MIDKLIKITGRRCSGRRLKQKEMHIRYYLDDGTGEASPSRLCWVDDADIKNCETREDVQNLLDQRIEQDLWARMPDTFMLAEELDEADKMRIGK